MAHCSLPMGICFWQMLSINATLSGHVPMMWKLPFDNTQSLRQVLDHWSHKYNVLERCAELPSGLRAIASPGGVDLDINRSMLTLIPSLVVTNAGLSVTIIWPLSENRVVNGALNSRSNLWKLRISTRYANVNGSRAGFHSSSTKGVKLQAGVYRDTSGKFIQTKFIDSMRVSALPSLGPCTLVTRVLVVRGTIVVGTGHNELFRAVLKGPSDLVANWEATCDMLDCNDGSDNNIPYPVFIPTRGRAHKAHLNWNADHVFGPNVPGEDVTLRPVICIVVEPSHEDEYREAWPHALTLVLPENGRGIGFARWVIQKTCTRAFVSHDVHGSLGIMRSWKLCRLPFCWIADDGLSMFYKLTRIGDVGADTSSGCHRLTKREVTDGKPMFWEAFLSVQRNPSLTHVAVAGFLRDDGTAVCKRLEWKSDVLSLYKIVLLNLGTLKSLGVEYAKDLQMYEDIFLTNEVLLKRGGHTLKCQKYCFRASHVKDGGCADQRVQRGGVLLQNLIAPSALKKLPSARKQLVMDLLQWVQSSETKFGKECITLGLSKPTKQKSLKRTNMTQQPTPHDHNAEFVKFRKLTMHTPVNSSTSTSSSSSTISSSSSNTSSSSDC